MKNWIMTHVVEKFLGGMLGKALSAANGKRTYIGAGIVLLLELVKFVLPMFMAVPAGVLDAVDSLVLVVTGATGAFASVKAEKLWNAMKQAGDATISAFASASSTESK